MEAARLSSKRMSILQKTFVADHFEHQGDHGHGLLNEVSNDKAVVNCRFHRMTSAIQMAMPEALTAIREAPFSDPQFMQQEKSRIQITTEGSSMEVTDTIELPPISSASLDLGRNESTMQHSIVLIAPTKSDVD